MVAILLSSLSWFYLIFLVLFAPGLGFAEGGNSSGGGNFRGDLQNVGPSNATSQRPQMISEPEAFDQFKKAAFQAHDFMSKMPTKDLTTITSRLDPNLDPSRFLNDFLQAINKIKTIKLEFLENGRDAEYNRTNDFAVKLDPYALPWYLENQSNFMVLAFHEVLGLMGYGRADHRNNGAPLSMLLMGAYHQIFPETKNIYHQYFCGGSNTNAAVLFSGWTSTEEIDRSGRVIGRRMNVPSYLVDKYDGKTNFVVPLDKPFLIGKENGLRNLTEEVRSGACPPSPYYPYFRHDKTGVRIGYATLNLLGLKTIIGRFCDNSQGLKNVKSIYQEWSHKHSNSNVSEKAAACLGILAMTRIYHEFQEYFQSPGPLPSLSQNPQEHMEGIVSRIDSSFISEASKYFEHLVKIRNPNEGYNLDIDTVSGRLTLWNAFGGTQKDDYKSIKFSKNGMIEDLYQQWHVNDLNQMGMASKNFVRLILNHDSAGRTVNGPIFGLSSLEVFNENDKRMVDGHTAIDLNENKTWALYQLYFDPRYGTSEESSRKKTIAPSIGNPLSLIPWNIKDSDANDIYGLLSLQIRNETVYVNLNGKPCTETQTPRIDSAMGITKRSYVCPQRSAP
jgi:hypothetical protein